MLAQAPSNRREPIFVDNLYASEECRLAGLLLHRLDPGLPLIAVTSNMSWLVAQEALPLCFVGSWPKALLRNVPFAIAVHAVYVTIFLETERHFLAVSESSHVSRSCRVQVLATILG